MDDPLLIRGHCKVSIYKQNHNNTHLCATYFNLVFDERLLLLVRAKLGALDRYGTRATHRYVKHKRNDGNVDTNQTFCWTILLTLSPLQNTFHTSMILRVKATFTKDYS